MSLIATRQQIKVLFCFVLSTYADYFYFRTLLMNSRTFLVND